MPEFRDLWQSQEVEKMEMSIEELRAKALKFQKRIQWRNLRELLAAAFAISGAAFGFVRISATVPRISFGLAITGAIYIVWHLRVRAAATAMPAGLGRDSSVAFYRRELEKQRDLLRNIWKWYLGPLVPGLALLTIWGIFKAPPERRWFPEVYGVCCVALFWGIGRLNHRAACRLDRQIDELKPPCQ
jgi:hypothetical protein